MIVRQRVRALAVEAGLKLVDQTKIVTAASELARNTVIYGGGGTLLLEVREGRYAAWSAADVRRPRPGNCRP